MRIGVIGAGNVGGNIGTRWAEMGHEVFFGVRNPGQDKYDNLRALPRVEVGSTGQAAAIAEVILLAIHYRDFASALPEIAPHIAGKLVIDATNPVAPGLGGLEVGLNTSAAEEIQKSLPEAQVVKCFNTLGVANLRDLSFGGVQADTFYCGDDDAAKATTHQLAELVGFRAVDVGPLSQARYLEPMAMLWITMAYKYGRGPNFAFKLIER